MFCGYCGKEIKNDALFCPECGKKVEYNVENKKKTLRGLQKSFKIVISLIILIAVVGSSVFGYTTYMGKKDTEKLKSLRDSYYATYDEDYQPAKYKYFTENKAQEIITLINKLEEIPDEYEDELKNKYIIGDGYFDGLKYSIKDSEIIIRLDLEDESIAENINIHTFRGKILTGCDFEEWDDKWDKSYEDSSKEELKEIKALHQKVYDIAWKEFKKDKYKGQFKPISQEGFNEIMKEGEELGFAEYKSNKELKNLYKKYKVNFKELNGVYIFKIVGYENGTLYIEDFCAAYSHISYLFQAASDYY